MKHMTFFNSLILSFAPLIFLYTYNSDKVYPLNLLKSLSLTFIILWSINKIIPKFTKDKNFESFLIYLTVLIIFYSGNIWIVMKTSGLFDLGFVLSLILIFLIGFLFPIYVKKKDLEGKDLSGKISHFINIFTKFLFLMFTLNLAFFHFKQFFGQNTHIENLFGYIEIKEPSVFTDRDIYYIIVDGYGRGDFLLDYYGYDNSEFINNLEELGFYVADKSTSNYSQTYLSLASSLNMDYLNFEDNIDREYGHTILNDRIYNGRAINFLRNNGYELKVNYSGWEALERFNTEQALLTFSEFEKIYLKTTIAKYFLPKNFDHIVHDRKTMNSIKFISSVDSEQNMILFAHIMSPHPPFIYDEEGNIQQQDHNEFQYYDGFWKELDGRSPELYRELYVKQTAFMEKVFLSLVKDLLNKPGNKPIIIIQADHGPASYESLTNEHTEIEYRERHSILNAYYFPDKDYSDLYKEITPVNTMRVVLNQFYGQDIELLEDKNYFSSYFDPFNFFDVTEKVN